jgi:glycosyltransferase involved in cell wall biosynthesis
MVKKKIIVISSGLRVGGVERSLIGLLDAFDYDRYEVSLFLYAHDGEFMGMIPAPARLLPEIPAYAAIEKPIRTLLRSRQFPIALARLAAKVVTAGRSRILGIGGFLLPRSVRYSLPFLPAIPGDYDLAISFLTPHDPVLAKVNARRRIGWIHTDYSTIECGTDKAFELPMWQRLDVIAAVADEVKNTFAKIFPELESQLIVIENILSPEFVRQQAKEFEVTAEMPVIPGELRLCSVGRFCHAKNFDSIPEVVQRLNGLGLQVRWYLVGYGGDEPLIRKKIAAAAVGDQVIILGKKTNPYPYMKACDLYVQPSRYEGKAVTIREAQILGKPVLITDFPTAKSQLEDGVDGLITPSGIEGIVDGIRKLIADPGLRERLAQTAAGRDYGNRVEVEKIYRLLDPDSHPKKPFSIPISVPTPNSLQEMPLVSIVIGCYNVARFLPQGLDGIIHQTYRNLEILLVDDGSTDETGRLCAQLAAADPRIRVFSKENGGLGSARNLGMDQARGKYLWFFDVDDAVEPDLVEQNVRIMEENQVELVIFGFYAHIEETGEVEKITYEEELITDNARLREVYCRKLFFARHGIGFCPMKFYRRSFIDQHGFRFGSQRIQQDEAFNLQFYPCLARVYVSGQAWYHYHLYTSGNTRSRYLADRFEIVTSIHLAFRKFCEVWRIADPVIREAVDRRYAQGIWMVIVFNLFHPQCPLRWPERCRKIAEIMSHDEARKCFIRLPAQPAGMEDRLFRFLFRHRLACPTFVYALARRYFTELRKRV